MTDVTFVEHVPCPHCGSKDNGARYSDGHAYCFGCSALWSLETGAVVEPRAHPRGLLRVDVRPLVKRALSYETCRFFGYGYATLEGRKCQVAPYYSRSGELVAQKARFPDKSFLILGDIKAALPLYGQHLWRDGGKRIVVTEGEIDAMSVAQAQGLKWPAVSVPHGAQHAARAVRAALEWLLGYEMVVFMLDEDEPGRQAARECAELLPPGRAAVARLALKDPNELVQAGRSKEIVDALWGAQVWRPDGILTGDEAWERLASSTSIPTATYPHSGMNERLVGARTGEIVLLCAGTGTGKTTWFREIAHHFAVTSGHRVGWIALEEDAGLSVLGFCAISLSLPLRFSVSRSSLLPLRTPLDMVKIREVYDRDIKDRVVFYDHRGVRDPGAIVSKVRYMAQGLGCKYVFLDHVTILAAEDDSGVSENRSVDRLMSSLSAVVGECQIGLLVISHLRKTALRGTPFEEGGRITLDDIKGSGSLKQIPADIIAVERDQQEDDVTARVRVLKCRFTGNVGLAGGIAYDRETGRLKEAENYDFASES